MLMLHAGIRARKGGIGAHHVVHAGCLHVKLEVPSIARVPEVQHGQPPALGRHVHGLCAVVVRVHRHAPPPDVLYLVVLADDLTTISIEKLVHVVVETCLVQALSLAHVFEAAHAVLHVFHHVLATRWEGPHRVGIAVSIHGGRIDDSSSERRRVPLGGGGGYKTLQDSIVAGSV